MSFMNALLSWVRTAHAGIAGKGESMANPTISGRQNLGQTPSATSQARRRSAAHLVSWCRVDSCSLRSTDDTWLSTVLTEM